VLGQCDIHGYVMQQLHTCRCTVIVYAHAEHCAHTWYNFGGFYMGPGGSEEV